MLDHLIEDGAHGLGLGDKARPFLGLLLGRLFTPGLGSLDNVHQRLLGQNLGPMFDSWLGQPDTTSTLDWNQFRAAVGSEYVGYMAHQLGLADDAVVDAGSHLLPRLIGALSPDGRLPAALPPELAGLLLATTGMPPRDDA